MLLVAVVAEVALEGKVAAAFVVAAGFAVALDAGCSCGDAGGIHFGIIPRSNALFTIYIYIIYNLYVKTGFHIWT